MKNCSDCSVPMINNVTIDASLKFEVGHTSKSRLHVHVPTGQTIDLLGLKLPASNTYNLKARVCPKCGKLELYVDINR